MATGGGGGSVCIGEGYEWDGGTLRGGRDSNGVVLLLPFVIVEFWFVDLEAAGCGTPEVFACERCGRPAGWEVAIESGTVGM